MNDPDCPGQPRYKNPRSATSYPLSFGQERLWFTHRLDPGDTAYNLQAAYRLRGPLDRAAFDAAFTEVVRRHVTLRSSVTLGQGEPALTVWQTEAVRLEFEKLDDIPPGQRLAEAQRRAAADAATPFDLTAGPPVRARLIELGDADHVWLLGLHHIICDGWSLNTLWRELTTLYTSFSADRPSPLPPLPIQYPDYVRRERDWAREGRFGKSLEYWRGRLLGTPALALPVDHPYPPFASSAGARTGWPLPKALTAELRALAKAERVTPFMVFLAAFQVLLARYCRQRDIALGLPVAGRTRPEAEPLVGFFANTVVLRQDVRLHGTFRELVASARSTVLDALDHQDVPFQQLVAQLRPPREPARPPIFQAMIAVEDPPLIPAMPGIRVERLRLERAISQFELTLGLHTGDSGTSISFEYATALFDRSTIRRMAGHYRRLLEQAAARPEARLDRLALVGEEERGRLLAAGRGPRPRPAAAPCLHQLVEAQAARVPGTTAVAHAARALTYAELVGAASRLAGHLRGMGVGPGTRVGLYAGRCPELITGILAILSAGGACVPIPPGQPAARTSYLLADAGIEFLTVAPGLAGPDVPGRCRAIPIAGDYGPPGPAPTGWHPPAGGDIAFVLYTSGSTGAPKAVELPHAGLVNVFTNMVASHRVTSRDRVLSFSAIGTDMCLEEIFLALCGGATTVLREEVVDTPARFFAACARLGLTVLGLPTAYWHELVAARPDQERGFGGQVRLVLIGGDRASVPHLRKWFSQPGPRVGLVNAYGPTETSVNATQHRFRPGQAERAPDWVPIGRPVPGAHLYVLDDGLEPVPVGVPGEVYIGGAGVARGYLGRPALTAERFLPDPYGTAPGGRVYRTGDLARWRQGGLLEFVGRVDDQVKVRGFRVEPAEAAAALCQHPDVADAIVVALPDATGSRRLAAYVVPAAGAPAPSGLQIREFLSGRLPGYLVPAVIVSLPELPRTGNGKVDRQALPPPEFPGSGGVAARAASSPLEKLLAGLWADTLAVPVAGLDDNFFDLGGHSLQAVQLAARVSEAVGADVSVKLIIAHPTIAGLAKALAGLTSDTCAGQPRAPAAPGPAVPAAVAGSRPPPGGAVPPPGGMAADFVEFESRPLLALIDAGELPGVDSATVSCIPDELLARRGIDLSRYLDDWCQGVPIITGIKQTHLGRIAHLIAPFPESRAYTATGELIKAVIPTLVMARRAGATVVSLINLLPSATGYGQAIRDAVAGRDDVPLITTGHATTTAAVVANTEHILREAGRDIGDETLTFLGLGSIGLSVLRLLLRRLPRPGRVVLCDLFSRREHLERVAAEVQAVTGAPAQIAVAGTGTVPGQVYESTLIVAATNVPGVVDAGRLSPGCIVVDDSAPHCFDPGQALERFHRATDVICVEGGELRSPEPWSEVRYIPAWVQREMGRERVRSWFGAQRHTIGGCVLSSLLAARFAEAGITVGLADVSAGERNHDLLARLGFGAASPELEDEVLDPGLLASFRARYGRGARAGG